MLQVFCNHEICFKNVKQYSSKTRIHGLLHVLRLLLQTQEESFFSRGLLFEITFANSRGGFFSRLLLQTQERASFRDYFCKLKRGLLFEITYANSRGGFFSRGFLFEITCANPKGGFFSRVLLFEINFANSRGGFFSRLLLQTQEESFFSRRLFEITFSLQIQEGTELLFKMGFFSRLSLLGLFSRFCCSSIYFGAKTCLPGLSSVRTCDEIPKGTQNRRNEECI